ncbi:MAG: hydrogenase maturation peptidase HycI [Anaerolineaceae bacterium]|nr:hydrogenase maturation peptidase HycI [Anaerolineaceae bacterium]
MKPSWPSSLRAIWKRLQSNGTPRVALLGMGQELRGDDAAGVLVAKHLATLLAHQADRLVIDGGSAPENFTGALRRFNPALVILVDAARMGEQPGEVFWIEADQINGFTGSTHSLPPTILASYLAAEIGCQIGMIGIQAGDMEFGTRVSPAVQLAARVVAEEIVTVLSE